MNKYIVTTAAAALSFAAATAHAATITATLPETNVSVNGPFTIGTFTYTLPSAETIQSVNVSGAFGNTTVPGSSARTPIIVDGIEVVECFGDFPPPDNGCNAFSFSFNFAPADFGLFTDNQAVATGDFISGGAVRISELTLTIETGTAAVPIPAAGFLLAGGLGSLAFMRRRRDRHS